MSAFSELGFRFAIDNLGAGFGSFNYMKYFPVHFLKIDSSLIERITKDCIDSLLSAPLLRPLLN